MTVEECYSKMDGDYADVLERLRNDERIAKYMLKFPDSPDYANLLEGLSNKDYELAFRSVHNLKGVSLNLSFTKLHETSDILCEALRGGEPKGDIDAMLCDVTKAYETVVRTIKEYSK